MGEKRRRNQTLTVRLTPKERSEIIRRAEKSRMSLTDYILAASTQTEIHVAEDTRPLIAELKRIGNNLNQITMKINAGAFQSYNFHEVLDMQRAIYEELRRIGKGGCTMATVTYIREYRQHISAMRAVMKYCMRDDKTWDEFTQRHLVSGVNCSGVDSIVEFEATKAAFQKMDGTNFYQYVQSFSPKENITPSQAHEIALEFAARAWPGTEVLVTTHCDTDHVHSHFVLNSVSFETGLKLRQSPNTLKELRMVSDQVCMAHGLGVLKPYEGGGSKLSAREWRAAQKGESWKFQLMYHIGESMKKSRNKEDFVTLMERKGYKMIWTETRAQITFICPNGRTQPPA